MFSVEELIAKYEKYGDEELFEMHSGIDSYSDEAKQAFYAVVAKKGGMEYLLARQNDKKILTEEILRIQLEVARLSTPGTDPSFLKKLITSTIISPDELSEIIETAYASVEAEREDVKIKPGTIIWSIIGGGIASVTGGTLWSLQLIYSKKIFIIFLIGLVLLCYGIIRLFTRQSRKNVAVLVATILSVLLALAIGQVIYEMVGYLE